MKINISLNIDELKFLYQKVLSGYSDTSMSFYTLRTKILEAKKSWDDYNKLKK